MPAPLFSFAIWIHPERLQLVRCLPPSIRVVATTKPRQFTPILLYTTTWWLRPQGHCRLCVLDCHYYSDFANLSPLSVYLLLSFPKRDQDSRGGSSGSLSHLLSIKRSSSTVFSTLHISSHHRPPPPSPPLIMPFSAQRAASQKRRTTRSIDATLDHTHQQKRSKPTTAPWRPSSGSITPPEQEENEERWMPPIQASSSSSSLAVAQSVIRRDGGECILCGDDGSIEENPLECVKIAWHDTDDEHSEQIAVSSNSMFFVYISHRTKQARFRCIGSKPPDPSQLTLAQTTP